MGLFDHLKKKKEAKQMGVTVSQYEEFLRLQKRGLTEQEYTRYRTNFAGSYSIDDFFIYRALEKKGFTPSQCARYVKELATRMSVEDYQEFLPLEKQGMSLTDYETYMASWKGRMNACEYIDFQKAQNLGLTQEEALDYVKSCRESMTCEEYRQQLETEKQAAQRDSHREHAAASYPAVEENTAPSHENSGEETTQKGGEEATLSQAVQVGGQIVLCLPDSYRVSDVPSVIGRNRICVAVLDEKQNDVARPYAATESITVLAGTERHGRENIDALAAAIGLENSRSVAGQPGTGALYMCKECTGSLSIYLGLIYTGQWAFPVQFFFQNEKREKNESLVLSVLESVAAIQKEPKGKKSDATKTMEENLAALTDALKERYRSGEKKAYSFASLREQNPDLPVGSIGVWAKRVYGQNAVEYVKAQGLLAEYEGPARQKPIATTEKTKTDQ